MKYISVLLFSLATLLAVPSFGAEENHESVKLSEEGQYDGGKEVEHWKYNDCSKASTKVEHLICSDETLLKLDAVLAFNYSLTMKRSKYKSYLKNSQRFWIKNIRSLCTDTACLKTTYKDRINLPIWVYSETPCNSYDKYENDGYKFGALIKDFLRTKNTEGLFSEGELEGPRKKYLMSKSFDDVFRPKWVEGVLEDENCGPLGAKGFLLSHGMIWYDYSRKNGKHIWHIQNLYIKGLELESFEEVTPKGWTVNDKLLTHKCFVTEWVSSDNFQEIAEHFGIKDEDDFSENPGMYVGSQINSYETIDASWGEKVFFIMKIDDCTADNKTKIKENGTVVNKDPEGDKDVYYQLIRSYNPNACKRLAPNINVNCLEAYLVLVGSETGGSMGVDIEYGIYGLFDLPNVGLSIVPLKYFHRWESDALNFIDETNS